MQNKIQTIIAQLEQSKRIRVLYACEAGSRAWGFPSSDSDYDVRFIYVHELDWYLSLCNHKDTITIQQENLDMIGWDLRKTLQLMKKSNAAPLEWMHSSIIYHAVPGFIRRFHNIGKTCFSPNAMNYHYLSMSRKFYNSCAGEKPVKLKTWFYALRTSLNARWIVEKQQIPPTLFQDTLSLVSSNIRKEILALIALKETKDEGFLFEKEDSLLHLMQECINLSEAHKTKLPGSKVNMHEMNHFFQRMVLKPSKNDRSRFKKSTPSTV